MSTDNQPSVAETKSFGMIHALVQIAQSDVDEDDIARLLYAIANLDIAIFAWTAHALYPCDGPDEFGAAYEWLFRGIAANPEE